ncbi:MAG: DUF4932 domain-containing protein [Candidatus Eisenbacteria sp.]|nr:DUF4932 domain-containing protein [Candidatus Eisenbacteria bacterium]
MGYLGRTTLVLVWVGLLLTLGSGVPVQQSAAAGDEGDEQAAGLPEGFSVRIDPRMELLAVVQHFSTWAPGGHIKSRTTYKRDIDDYFAGFEEHRAVAWMDSLVAAEFTHDAPVRLILHHQDPPDLRRRTPYSDYLITRAGGEPILDAFVAALRDFARATDFMAFYRAHRPLYDLHVREVCASLAGKDYVRALEEFFGESRDGYHLILPPLFAGGYGPGIQDKDRYDLYAVIGPCARKDDRTTFGCRRYLESIMLHEWSHSFVNPLVDQWADEFRASARLFDPIRGMMTRQAYPSWKIALYEHIVRAAEINIRATLYEDFDKESALRVHEGQGFWYVGPVDSLLEVYQAHREQYASFGRFVPVIARALSQLSIDELPLRVTSFSGPLSGVFPRAERIYLVYPTGSDHGISGIRSLDEEMIRRLQVELEGFAGFLASFQMPSRIISDREAMAIDWKDKVAFVYGSGGGNLFLRSLEMAVPLEVAEGTLEFAGERYAGEGIVLISCLPNPFNATLPFVVCVANRPEDLIGLGERVSSPEEWEADYILYRGDERLAAGRYRRMDGAWRR